MKQSWKRVFSVILTVLMVLTMALPGLAANAGSGSNGVSWTKVGNRYLASDHLRNSSVNDKNSAKYADDEVVRVSIVLDGKSTLEQGYATKGIAANTEATKYRDGLKKQQDAVAARITKNALAGKELDVVWNITLAANIISANVEYGKIDAIKKVVGVKDVVVENQYFPEETKTSDSPNQSTATGMTGTTAAWASDYTGAGSRVAIVDTGLDTDHQSFDAKAFEYAIDELNAKRAEEGKAPVALLTEADVKAVWGKLNIAGRLRSVNGIYRDAKVPFGANYVDSDYDITHDNDTQGEHGSHVAGIAAANKYIPNGDGTFANALELDTVLTQGQAPDAQLIIMKVFGKGGGAYDSDYMVAIEDAIVLDADSVNLSLGSSSAGFTTNARYAAILDKFAEYDTVVTISAGNNNSWSSENLGELYDDDINYHTGGSPGTYTNSLAVASIDNSGFTGPYLTYNGKDIFYTETSGYGNAAFKTIAGEYEFVYIDSPGTDAEFAAVKDVLSGKIALCNRGSTSFFEKANAAVANGAIATIIVNNQPGTISMNLTGYEYTRPAVSITQSEGQFIKDTAELKTSASGAAYYTGKITVSDKSGISFGDSKYLTMSDFSSWGGNGALTMKPEITAPGGNIWSVNGAIAGGKAYETMSGTSMAAPQVAGITAVVAQYIRENGLEEKTGLNVRQLTQSLLMSTSTPVIEEATDNYYSILKQGSGLANVEAVINAKSFIKMDKSATASYADGKVKAELGEVKRGSDFTVSFALTNFSDEAISYDLSADFFTQLIADGVRSEYTTPLTAAVVWKLDGKDYTPAARGYDFNGDGAVNSFDAQTLLDYLVDGTTEIFNLDSADLDNDGDVDTRDAFIAFEELNKASTELAAGETVNVTATVTLTVPKELDVNGNYIEGFLFVKESDTADGALGVSHSIPVYGFYGSISEASMFDKGSAVEYTYGLEERVPYMIASSLGNNAYNVQGFLFSFTGASGSYMFGGNPLVEDDFYDPARNAIGPNMTIASARYSAIRNASASRFFVTNQLGNIIDAYTIESSSDITAAYYYANQGTWQSTNGSASINFTPANSAEGTKLVLNYQHVPEYYVNADDSVRWDEVNNDSALSIPAVVDNTVPYIVGVDVTDNRLVVSAHDNEYIALVALYNEAGDELGYFGGVENIRRGEQVNYAFDLSKVEDDHLLVEVWDYALNISTYKINLNPEELENPEVSVVLNASEILIMGKGTAKLSATVYPWGFEQDEVVWTSANESIATVDNNGLVTVTADKDGSTVITATSVYDPTASASCVVNVVIVDKELNGVVWDEYGEVWISDFNLKSLPDYEPLHKDSFRLPLASLTYDETGTLYGATFDDDEWSSNLYIIDEDTYETTLIGSSEIGFMDICEAPSLGKNHLLAVYGPYVLIVNKTTGAYEGVFNLESFTGGNYLVGIAYEEQYYYGSYGNTDWVFLLDEAGNVYNTGFLPYGGSYSRFGVSQMGRIADSVDIPYFQSFYFDGNNLYWSRFNDADNFVEIVMVKDIYSDGSAYSVGKFADSVWPVGGLYEKNVVPYFDFNGAPAETHANAVIDTDAVLLTSIEPLDRDSKKDTKPAAAPKKDTDKPNAVDTPTTITITADEDTTNGLYTVKYDPTKATLVSVEENFTYKSVSADELLGTYAIAFVEPDGVKKGDTLVVLNFEETSTGAVQLVEDETNNNHPYDEGEEDAEQIIYFGSISGIAGDDGTFTGPEWLWEDDYSNASATFTKKNGVTVSVYADITEETTPATHLAEGKIVYTATVEFDTDADEAAETYTSTKEVVLEKLAEHVYGEPEWTWADDYSSAAAKFVCEAEDDTQTVTADVTVETTDATYTEAGKIVYTAAVEFEGETYTDTKTVEIPAIGYTYGEPEFKWDTDAEGNVTATATFTANEDGTTVTVDAKVESEITLQPTHTEDGTIVYTATVEFDADNDGEPETYTSEPKEETIPALGHNWGEPTWTWSEDYKTAVAKFVCADDEETKYVDAAVEVTENVAATAGKEGKIVYTATVELDGETYTDSQTVVLEALPYTYGEPTFEWTITDDNATAVATFTANEDSTVSYTLDAYVTSEVTKEATHAAEGEITYTAVVMDSEGNTHTDTKTAPIAKTEEHTYGKPVIKWNDDFTAAAEVVCTVDGDTKTLDVTVTSKVTKEATHTAEGEITYTATVTFNGVEYSDTKTAPIAKVAEHTYGEPVITWNDDNTATATVSCVDGDDTQTLAVTVTSKVTKEATHTAEGEITYTATVTFNGVEYSDTKTAPIAKIAEHTYGEPVITWNDDNTATATVSCVDGDDTQTLEVTVTSVTTDPTTETEGKTVYTASVTFNGKTTTSTKEVTIPKLEPAPDEGTAIKTAFGFAVDDVTIFVRTGSKTTPSTVNALLSGVGDVNGDGELNTVDYIMVKRAILGTVVLTDAQKIAADVNGDGELTTVDYIMIKRALVGSYTFEGEDYNYYKFIVVDADNKVVAINTALGLTTEGALKGGTTIPEGGYIIGGHAGTLDTVLETLEVGDEIKLENVNLEELAKVTEVNYALTDASFTVVK